MWFLPVASSTNSLKGIQTERLENFTEVENKKIKKIIIFVKPFFDERCYKGIKRTTKDD